MIPLLPLLIGSVLRSVFLAGGGATAASGAASQTPEEILVGVVLASIGAIWSAVEKYRRSKNSQE